MNDAIRNRSRIYVGLLGLAALAALFFCVGDSEAVNKSRLKKARAITHGKLKFGKVRPQAPVSPPTQEGLLCVDAANGQGAFIRGVRQDSAAFNAGLQQGDVIFGVEDQRVNTAADFAQFLGQAMDQGAADVVLSVTDVNTGQATLVQMQIVTSQAALKRPATKKLPKRGV